MTVTLMHLNGQASNEMITGRFFHDETNTLDAESDRVAGGDGKRMEPNGERNHTGYGGGQHVSECGRSTSDSEAPGNERSGGIDQ